MNTTEREKQLEIALRRLVAKVHDADFFREVPEQIRAADHLDVAMEMAEEVLESHPTPPAQPVPVVPDRPLAGEWRHSQGMIFCGTLRISKEDFDTNPSEEFKAKIFDWICKMLNAGPCEPPKGE